MTPDGETIALKDGRRIGYGAGGAEDGRPVFFFHGTPGSRLDRHVGAAADLAGERGIRLLVLERPGYGVSDRAAARRVVDWADDVSQVADALGAERFSVYGYSGGGPFALACGARLADRVDSVAVVSGVGVPGTPGGFDGMGTNERTLHRLTKLWPRLVDVVYRMARRNAQRNPDRFFKDFEKDCSESDLAVLADPDTRQAVRASVVEALRADVGGAVDDWVNLERRPWGFAPEDVRVPTTLFFGDADRFVPVANGRDLARRIPDATAVEIPGEGHLLIIERLGQILDALAPARG